MEDEMENRKACTVLIIVLTILCPQSDSTAVITTEGSLRDRSAFECNTSVVITCTTQPNPNEVVWRIDSVSVADCSFGICSVNPSIPAFYTFNQSVTEGVFNLSIQPVSFQQNGKIYSCEEGTTSSDSLTADVYVLPDSASILIDTTSDTQLTVTTGCVYPETEITFEWYIYQSGMDAAIQYTEDLPVQTANGSACSSGDCGYSDAKRVSSSLTITAEESGDLYYFKVIVRHAAASSPTEVKSMKRYRIKGDQDSSSWCSPSYCLWLIICGIIFVLFIIGVVLCYCWEKGCCCFEDCQKPKCRLRTSLCHVTTRDKSDNSVGQYQDNIKDKTPRWETQGANPRPLQKLPRVASTSFETANAEMHTRLPPINPGKARRGTMKN